MRKAVAAMHKPYFLSVKALVRDTQGRCLIIRRSAASRHNAGCWDLPGGKLDAGETLDAALVREVAEETGLKVGIARIAGAAESVMAERTIAYLIFEAEVDSSEVRLSSEHDRYEWVLPPGLGAYEFCGQFASFISEFVRRHAEEER